MSLRWRIALALALVAGIIGSLATLGSFLTTSRQVYRSIDDTLLARATLASPTRGGPGGPRDRSGCPFGIALQSVDVAQIVAPDGSVTVCIDGTAALPNDVEIDVTTPGAISIRTVRSEDSRYRVLSLVLRDDQVLQIGRDLDEARSVLGRLRTRLFVLAFGGIALAGLSGWLIARRIVRPVVELRDAAETIARTQDLRTPIPSGGDDELGSLSRSLTTMVGALATSREQQQRLVADASHEMRTPLTSLRTNVELLAHFEQLDLNDRTATLNAIGADVGELTHLLTELVELATDRAGSDEPVEPVELAELAADVAARARRRSGRSINVTATGPAEAVLGRPRMLERAISNLVDNAVKYTSADHPIEVIVGPRSVEVADCGPGIAPADLPHVFERFYRATTARTTTGSGLGLAIVEQIAERHGGRVWAANCADGPGARVGFELPETAAPRQAERAGGPDRA